MTAAGTLRGDLRDACEGAGPDRDEQPPTPTLVTVRPTVSSPARTVPAPSWTTGEPPRDRRADRGPVQGCAVRRAVARITGEPRNVAAVRDRADQRRARRGDSMPGRREVGEGPKAGSGTGISRPYAKDAGANAETTASKGRDSAARRR